jgi:tetratricopeptide (TPR) repeat protein
MVSDDDDDPPEPPDELLAALAATPSAEVLSRGTLIDGQYRIERVLGEGGMGVVYLARDIRLERDVAIKVGIVRSAASIERLAREAVALARLSHPNVVVLHEIGEIKGRSYVAMEYVAGGTARAWCKGRGWREIVRLYLAAGDGLAAAHAAGLVHRDFKPDNVLVGSDGRPRVADFGLARDESDAVEITAEGVGESRAATATKTGAVVGTPAYMAPEQFARGDIDARVDQFSFCASVWEALFGERPFPDRKDGGALPEPKRPDVRTKVPRHIEAALRRGLRDKRDERWPTLEPLLAEVRRDPGRRRMQLLVGAGVLVLAAGAGAVVHARGSGADPCDGGAAQLAATWSSARAKAVHAAIAPAGAPAWIEAAATRVTTGLDDWTRRWAVQYRAVCVARHGTWSAELSDRGVECLADRKRELAATVDVIASTPNIGAHVDSLVEKLAAPERCADPAYLKASVPPPSDPAQAARVAPELAELAKIEVMSRAGQFDRAAELANTAFTRAKALGVASLIGRAQMTRGAMAMMVDNNQAAFDDLHEAYFVARDAKDARTAAECAATTALALLNLSRNAEAPDWARLAGIEAASAGDPESDAQASNSLATVALVTGKTDEAFAQAEHTLAASRRIGTGLPSALRIHASVLDRIGRFDAALADLDEAIRVVRTRYGDQHPQVSLLEDDRALVLMHLHRSEDAVAAARHSLAVAEATTGADSGPGINALAILGTTLKDARHLDEALPILDRSLELTKAHDGPRSFNTASTINDRADLLREMEHFDDALVGYREAISIFTEIQGPKGYDVGLVSLNVANCLYEAGRLGEVGPAAAAAMPALASAPDSPIYARDQILIAVGDDERRDWAHAKATLAAALAKIDADDRVYRGRAHLALARAEHGLGNDATAREDANAALSESEDPATKALIEQFLRTLK